MIKNTPLVMFIITHIRSGSHAIMCWLLQQHETIRKDYCFDNDNVPHKGIFTINDRHSILMRCNKYSLSEQIPSFINNNCEIVTSDTKHVICSYEEFCY